MSTSKKTTEAKEVKKTAAKAPVKAAATKAERTKMEIRLTGSGGQGVILATIILAEAGVEAGKFVAQSQAYGPEARGGSCKAEVIIDEKPIGFTKVEKPTFFMALTQKALDQYAPGLSKHCIVLLDSSLETPECLLANKVYKAPILESAIKEVGKAMTANIVAVGAINAILNLVSDEDLHTAVMSHVPKGTEELNEKALKVGMKLIKK